MPYPVTHLATPAIAAAIAQLELALVEFRNGPEGYRCEREFVKETLKTLRTVLADVAFEDEQRSPAARADALAWDRQTRPTLGKPVLGGL